MTPANIKTEYWAKPIPDRSYDWQAYDDDVFPDGPIGSGATEQEAIADLMNQTEHGCA